MEGWKTPTGNNNWLTFDLIIKEFSNSNNEEPFYPINNNKNKIIYNKYKNYLKSKDKKFIFGGRLGDYAYYDMDMTISAALKKFQHIKKNFS